MAYQIPERWAHGDYPTAAKLNKYKDGLDAIHAALGDYRINPAVSLRIDPVDSYYFVRRHRYLLYLGAGEIRDPMGVGEAVSLSAGVGGSWAVRDLSSIDWMVPGKLYQVDDVQACIEDYEGL